MSTITPRELRCLRRIADRKSIPDMGAWASLETKGFIEIRHHGSHPQELEIGDIENVITSAGRTILAANEPAESTP